jgi:hypothetical protein
LLHFSRSNDHTPKSLLKLHGKVRTGLRSWLGGLIARESIAASTAEAKTTTAKKKD